MVILIIHLGSREVSHRAYVLDTDAFELVVGTDFIVHHPEVKALGWGMIRGGGGALGKNKNDPEALGIIGNRNKDPKKTGGVLAAEVFWGSMGCFGGYPPSPLRKHSLV